jgi:hypothetical protein
MKFINQRPYTDPAVAARKLLEIANATEAVQDGRIYIEKINGQFLFKECAGGAQRRRAEVRYRSGLTVEERVRNICEVHGGGRRVVRCDAARCSDRHFDGCRPAPKMSASRSRPGGHLRIVRMARLTCDKTSRSL